MNFTNNEIKPESKLNNNNNKAQAAHCKAGYLNSFSKEPLVVILTVYAHADSHPLKSFLLSQKIKLHGETFE